jgi:hypothetical protein
MELSPTTSATNNAQVETTRHEADDRVLPHESLCALTEMPRSVMAQAKPVLPYR